VTEASTLTADEQSAMLADLYSARARLYDSLWSPVIRPVGERLLDHLPLKRAREVVDVGTGAGALLPSIRKAAPNAVILGVDRSEGMLRLAREKHTGPLAIMDAARLQLSADRFDVAVVAFVLFHLPKPEECLREVHRVLRQGGAVGTVTWAAQHPSTAGAIWEEEVKAAGARTIELPAVENRSCCDTRAKVASLLRRAGFRAIKTWTDEIVHQWRPLDHFEYQLHSSWREEIESLSSGAREDCLTRVRGRLSGQGSDQYIFRGTVVVATALKAAASARRRARARGQATTRPRPAATPS
jgi:ubiquinone/menaquinone biosynthesis C-methylase UbiE